MKAHVREITYSGGQYFVCDSTGDIFILATPTFGNEACLIALRNGNRLRESIVVEDRFSVSAPEIEKMSGPVSVRPISNSDAKSYIGQPGKRDIGGPKLFLVTYIVTRNGEASKTFEIVRVESGSRRELLGIIKDGMVNFYDGRWIREGLVFSYPDLSAAVRVSSSLEISEEDAAVIRKLILCTYLQEDAWQHSG